MLAILIVEVPPVDDASSSSAGRSSSFHRTSARAWLAARAPDPRELLVGRRSLRRGRSDARVPLLLEPGDADLEELSSRLELKIARNFARSSSGCDRSSASANTRPLKSNQDHSRFR